MRTTSCSHVKRRKRINVEHQTILWPGDIAGKWKSVSKLSRNCALLLEASLKGLSIGWSLVFVAMIIHGFVKIQGPFKECTCEQTKPSRGRCDPEMQSSHSCELFVQPHPCACTRWLVSHWYPSCDTVLVDCVVAISFYRFLESFSVTSVPVGMVNMSNYERRRYLFVEDINMY